MDYSVLEFSWHIRYPEKSKMIVKAFAKSDTDIYKKTVSKYGDREQEIYYRYMQDVDATPFRWSTQKTIDILKWFLKGFNEDFLSRTLMRNNDSLEKIQDDYVTSLSEYMEILKTGIIK